MSNLAEPDVAVSRIKTVLSADATLLAKQVTINGTPRVLQGVFHPTIPQDQTFPYPAVVIGIPFQAALPQIMRPNGPHVTQGSFLIDVWAVARDVALDDAGLLAIKGRIIELLPTISSGTVSGGRTNGCVIEAFPPAIRDDRGSYVYVQQGVTVRVVAEVT